MLCDAAVGFRKVSFRRAAPRSPVFPGDSGLLDAFVDDGRRERDEETGKERKPYVKKRTEVSPMKPRWKLQSQPRFPDYLLLFPPVALTSALRRIKIKPRFRNNGETLPVVFLRGTGSSSGHEKSRGHNNKTPIEYHAPIHIAWIETADPLCDPFERKRKGRNS